jgi:CSLREA domain-containing protein
MRRFNIQLDTDTATQYRGNALGEALAGGRARSVSMSVEDLNGDGMPELITGHSFYGGGAVALRMGNLNAIAPQTPELFEGYRNGRYPSPFLNEVTTFELPQAPDFMVTGDFNADGFADLAAAARGGEVVYLLPGDGRGNLGSVEEFNVPGQITAMIKGEFNARDSLTDLIVAVASPEGASALVFEGRNRGLTGRPEEFSLPGAASGLALGHFGEGINVEDLAASVGNSVVLVNGCNPRDGSSNSIEVINVPYNIASIAAGNFLFDRENKSKLALLASDGNIHFMTRGELDTRAYSQTEQDKIKELRIAIRRALGDNAELTALQNSMIERPKTTNWVEAGTRNVGTLRGAGAGALMTAARVSSLPTDDLLFIGSSSNQLQILRNTADAQKLHLTNEEASAPTESFPVSDVPVAVVAARLSIDNRPSMVVLKQGNPGPQVVISASTIFNVTKTADTADGTCNADCSLREATVAANHTSGSHTINVPNGTYTLTRGPFDDDFNFGGDAENTGDLDIIPFNLSLTGVSIVGASQAGTIVQMGTLSPAGTGTGAGITKDRIFEVNNFIDPQRGLAVSLSNMTFQNGASASTAAPDNFHHLGGAIMFDGFDQPSTNPTGTLTLTSMTLTNNSGSGGGGGLLTTDASLTIQTSSIISSNTAVFAAGGGISYNGGNKVAGQTLTITASTIGGGAPANGNLAMDSQFGNGGGIGVFGGAGVIIQSNSVISNNTANAVDAAGPDSGGGGILFGIAPAIAISNTNISSNKAKIHGGGMWVNAKLPIANSESTITLTGTSVTGNQADSDATGTGDGGGVDLRFGAMTVQTTSHIDSNSAINGGGIFAQWNAQTNDKPASLTVNTSSTIGQSGAGNTAKGNGGGLAIDLGGNSGTTPKTGAVTLTSINIVNNTANSDNSGGGDGGGIYYDGNNSNFVITLAMNGVTIDSNVANSGTDDGMFMDSGAATNSNTISFNGDDSLNINGGTFTSTSGNLNLTGNFTKSSTGTFTHNSGTVNFNGAGAQNINGTAPSEAFNNFTMNKGAGTLTVGGSTTTLTISGNVTLTAGTFAAGTATAIGLSSGNWTNNGATFTPASSVVSFTNTAGAQSINGSAASQTFNSITMSKTAQTLSVAGSTTTLNLNGNLLLTSGTFSAGTATGINVGGNWTNNGATFTPGSGTVTFNGGGAQSLTGTAATQTFNNFAVNKATGTLTGVASTTALNAVNLTITAGTFAAGSLANINVSGNWANTGTFTAGSGTVTLNGAGNNQTLTGTTTFNNLTSNHTGLGSVDASTSSLTVSGLMRVQAGTFTSASTFNNVQIDSGATLAGTNGTIMNVAGNWTNNGTFTANGNTVNFNGGGAQNLGGSVVAQVFNNFSVTKTGGTLAVIASTTALDINGDVTLTSGTFAAGTAVGISVAGNWTNNGATFTPGTGTVTFDGAAGQTISGTTATTFNNLTNGDPGGISMNNDNTVGGTLALGTNDITVANTRTLSQTSATASTGTGDVIGSVKRTNTTTLGTAYTFGNPNNRITTNAGTAPTDITVNLVKAVPSGGMPFPTAVQRTYTVTPTGGSGLSATVRLHYLDGELNGNTEAGLGLFRFNGTDWVRLGSSTADTAANWVELTGVTQFSAWTLSSGKNNTNTTITSDLPDPSNIGQSVTVNFNVASAVTGAPAVTGNVTITVDDASGDTCTGSVSAGNCPLVLTTLGAKTLTATYAGDSNFNGGSGTAPHLVSAADIFARDAQAPEPSSGTSNMLFTVVLSVPATSPISVNYATADGGGTPATGGTCAGGADYETTSGTVNFLVGQRIKTVPIVICSDAAVESNETLLLNLTAPVGGSIVDGQAVGTITSANTPGDTLISEVRTSGPGGTADDFVEIYNNTNAALTVAASDASAGYGVFKLGADCNAIPVLVGTIPNGTVIPARGHYLLVGSTYSLGAAASGNLTLTADIENDANVALFNTADVGNLSSVTRLDAVGFGTNMGGGICDLLREGTNLPALSGSTLEYSFHRDQCGKGGNPATMGPCGNTNGTPIDSNNNNADFILTDTTASLIGQHLGAPGPENLLSPIQRNASFGAVLIDATKAAVLQPNRDRNFTGVPNGTLGTLSIRRRFINNTGAAVTRLRFRIVDMSSLVTPGAIADLRAFTSLALAGVAVNDAATCLATGTPTTAPCTVTIQGTTLETPPAQSIGGALNSTLGAGTITLGTPLPNGASVNLQFLLGVQSSGAFKFFINIEALP